MAIRNQDAIDDTNSESGINGTVTWFSNRELGVQMANGIYEDTPDRDNAHLEVTVLSIKYL